MEVRTGLKRGAQVGGCVLAATSFLMLIWSGASSWSWGMTARGSEILILPMLGAVLCVPIGALLLIFRKTRAWGSALLVGGLIVAVPAVFVIRGVARVRMAGFERFCDRSKPLVAAIHAYESEHGRPPPDLAALVPEFLAAVPPTDVGSAPEYDYLREPEGAYWGNSWTLRLRVPVGFINWDELIYVPDGNYPKRDLGGWYEHIGDWAYLHE